ncbi:MAG: WYL domain-containing protein, partial [Spirochaetota bacterium]|nr:WYL domain-containing protein [Spirochaetota bacterium]
PVPDATDPDAIDLSLPVHNWTEILGRALRCGSNCEVLGPPEFRKLWEEEIKRMVEKVGEK